MDGKIANNPAAEQPHGVKEWLYKNYSIFLGATMWHTWT
jgi:hypothetical protein